MSELEKARIAVMEAVGYTQKTGQHGQGYSYASEGDLIRSLRGQMIAHGLTMAPVDVQVTAHRETGKQLLTEAVVTYALRHSTGEELRVAVLSTGADVGDKAAFKLMTGAEKYALRQAFLIETGDDPEREDHTQGNGAEAAPPGISEEGMTELANRFADCDSHDTLRAAWESYKLNEYQYATPAQRGEIETYKNTRKNSLKGGSDA